MQKTISFLFSFAFFFCLLAPASAHAASLVVSPAQGSYAVGENIRVRVLVSSDVSVNAVSAALSFSSNTLSAESVSKSGSFLSFWTTDPTFSNGSASLTLEGVSPGTGYSGSGGIVAIYTFKATHAGTGTISFQSGSVLANDGQGTNVLNDLHGASFTITPAPTSPPVEKKTEIPLAPSVTTPTATTTVTSDTPIITLGSSVISGTETQVVYGLSKYANASATLFIGSTDSTALHVSMPTADDGSFTIPLPNVLKPGVYSVHATVQRSPGDETLPSDTLSVRIPYSLASYAWSLIPYVSIIALIILLVGALFFIFWYGSLKLIKKQQKLGTETHQAQEALHKSFDVLRQDIADHLKEIRRVQSVDPGEEKDVLINLKKDLDDAEGYIQKGMEGHTKKKR